MKIEKSRWLIFFVLIATCLFFLFEKDFLSGISSKFTPDNSFELLGTIIRLIKSDYIEEAEPAKTMEGAFRGMIHSLDMLSSYLDRENTRKFIQPQKTSFKDVGIILFKRYGFFPLVVGVVENSPAEKGGIKIGDSVSALDDQSTLLWGLVETNLYLKNKDPKPVKIRIIRENSTQEIKLERAALYSHPFSFSPQKETSGILKIHHFFPPLTEEVKQRLLPQIKNWKKPLILDLRNCHEGDFEEAGSLINLFLKAENIGYFKKKEDTRDILSLPKDAELENLPLIVWVNQGTVGPAELVAGVLKSSKRAKIIGIQTPGLVAKQDLFSLANGDALLLTTGTFYLASGEELWGRGVAVDAKVETSEPTQKSYLEKTLNLISHS